MTYRQILPLHNLNFQMNRVLAHDEEACHEEELLEFAPKLRTLSSCELDGEERTLYGIVMTPTVPEAGVSQ